ncbi:hypothetical protein NT6N_03410 [Oceaniferula spumae]|uniref:Ice-binding protein C-terminal domain-containing protein n=1 Tax=Oceaniferula spumae TaxID=2979115 RepID=A0AAT9FH47_9BACT
MKYTSLILVAGTLSCASLNAASITWTFTNIASTGPSGNTMGTGALDNSDTFVYAENTGGSALIFDGISFDEGTINFAANNPAFTGFHSTPGNSPISSTGTYGSGADGPELAILGTGGVGGALTVNDTYRVQLIIMDGRGSQSQRTFEVDGIATDHAQGTQGVTWGPVLLATGTFTADSASQAILLDVKESTGGSAGAQLNGLVLHNTTVPEPSSIAMLGLGSIALLRRRR